MAKQLTVKQALASAKKAAKKGDFPLARQMYQAVLDRHPAHMTAQKGLRKLQKADSGKDIGKQTSPPGDELQRVISLYRSGQMAPAEAGARKILTTCPEEPVALNILGSALQLQGKLDPALEVFDRMIRLNPAEAGNYYNRGITRHNSGRLNGAAEDFRKVLELNPGFAEAFNWLGLTLNSLDQPDKAEKSYTKAIELKPELAEAYNNRALVLGRLGKPIHAIEDCDRAIALNSGLAEPHNIKGGLYSTSVNGKRRWKAMIRPLDSSPNLSKPWPIR